MNRLAVLLVLGGAIVFVGVPLLVLTPFWFPSADANEILARAQPTGDRLAAALSEYRAKHGRYPTALEDLVAKGFLDRAPKLPTPWIAGEARGPHYRASEPLDFYQLYFGYFVPEGVLGDDYYRELVSDDPKGWQTTQSPASMEDLAADRILAKYRRDGDGKSLSLFMSEVSGKVDCNYLYRSRVERWLGAGAEVEPPLKLRSAGRRGYAYQAKDEPTKRYGFLYKDHWLPGFDNTAENYPVLDRLFLIEGIADRAKWTLLRECPKSRHDAPPIGLRAVVPPATNP